jgi:hypothetical protein
LNNKQKALVNRKIEELNNMYSMKELEKAGINIESLNGLSPYNFLNRHSKTTPDIIAGYFQRVSPDKSTIEIGDAFGHSFEG